MARSITAWGEAPGKLPANSLEQSQSCYTQREQRLDWIFHQEKSFLFNAGPGT
jgi:hypothetical protein